MMTVENIPARDIEGSTETIVRRIQQALAPVGPVEGVSIYRKMSDGSLYAIFENGEFIPVAVSPRPDMAIAESDIFCDAMEDGARVLLRDECAGPTVVNLVGALLQASLRALEVEGREELLLEEVGANWESLEAMYEISTHSLYPNDVKDRLQLMMARLTALQDGLLAALFIRRENLFYPLVGTGRELQPMTCEQLGPAERAVRAHKVVLMNRIAPDAGSHAPWRKATSLAVAPFSWPGCLGFVAVWSERQGCEFKSFFSKLLEAITYQASVIMEADRLQRKVRDNELLAQEIEIASSIQQTLLLANAPKDVPNLEIATCSVPSHRIDGDFHDFFQHPDGTVDVLIGDVMGKGVAAALLGAATKSQFFRATANLALQSQERVPTPTDIVTRAASRISDRLIQLERFVTLCYARFNAGNNCLVFVDCGHTSMIRESKSMDNCAFLPGVDLPLGVLPDFRCQEQSVAFRPGETYVLYSDGVTESRSPSGEMFGPERLAECVQNWSSLGPTLLVEQLRKAAMQFTQSEKFSDDFTCIAVRIRLAPIDAEPIHRKSATFPCGPQSLTSFRSWLEECVTLVDGCLWKEDVSRLQLACSEVFANCLNHVHDAPSPAPVSAESRIFADHLTVEIFHRGPAFDPLGIPPPSFDGSRDGGFGIYIILRSSDEASFARRPDGTNVTTLSFLRSTRGQNS
jgi:sigma-B regulation protein RsbU (phosphoserine phosphatase)